MEVGRVDTIALEACRLLAGDFALEDKFVCKAEQVPGDVAVREVIKEEHDDELSLFSENEDL